MKSKLNINHLGVDAGELGVVKSLGAQHAHFSFVLAPHAVQVVVGLALERRDVGDRAVARLPLALDRLQHAQARLDDAPQHHRQLQQHILSHN